MAKKGLGKLMPIILIVAVVGGGYYAYKHGLIPKIGGGSKGSSSKSSGSYGSYPARRRAFLGQLNTGYPYQDTAARGAGI
jgi:hypothetical protein